MHEHSCAEPKLVILARHTNIRERRQNRSFWLRALIKLSIFRQWWTYYYDAKNTILWLSEYRELYRED